MAATGWDSLLITVGSAPVRLGAVVDAGVLTGLQAVQLRCDTADILLGGPERSVYSLKAGEVQVVNSARAGDLYMRCLTGTVSVQALLVGD